MVNTVVDPFMVWESWDSMHDGFDLVLYDVKLTKQIGGFIPGAKFRQAMFLFSSCQMILVDDQYEEHPFELSVSIGKESK